MNRKRIISGAIAFFLVITLLCPVFTLPVSAAGIGAPELLSKIAYYGDPSKCVMDKDMALAYAEAIESLPKTLDLYDVQHKPFVMLADVAKDGKPILITIFFGKSMMMPGDPPVPGKVQFWGYQNGSAYDAKVPRLSYYNGFGYLGKQGAFRTIDFFHDVGNKRTGSYYSVSNGEISLARTIDIYDAYIYENQAYGEFPKGYPNNVTESYLADKGWIQTYDASWELVLDNGKNITREARLSHDEIAGFSQTEVIANISDVEHYFNHHTTPAAEAANLLREYADIVGKPSYSYEDVTDLISKEHINEIKAAISSALNGKLGDITAIYKLSEGVYYVVVTLDDGSYAGAVIKEVKAGDGKSFKVETSSNKVMSEKEIDAYVSEMNARANIAIDYGETREFKKIKDYIDYLKHVLGESEDSSVNDAGKSDIAAYIENAITSLSKNTVKANNNIITIKGKDIKKSVTRAFSAKTDLEKSLKEETVHLNKEITIIIRIDGANLDIEKPLQVTLDESVLDQMGDAEALMILLGDNKHGIKLTSVSLKTIINEYKAVNLQLKKVEKGVYNIAFADRQGETIEKLPAPVGFFLPADNELATVLASYGKGSDNWGGQYDSVNGTIEYSTIHSGKYEVLENQITINDIEELTDDQQQAIRFMVSKGYFGLEGDSFLPENNLTRYDFTEAIVRMFFALDRGLETSFTDVSPENEYYDFIASAEKDSIVEGYNDQTFRGELNISREQVIALCARTLAEKKGYSYPENPGDYLNFSDQEEIAQWAKEDIALAVREGLIDNSGNLGPKDNINRADSAEMLYKLFMLLYETAPVEFVVDESASGINPVIPIGIAGVVLIGGGVMAVRYLRPKTER